ncbi:uncharacterized protein LOC117509825 [Thalassophryne amazonica]|uniref:uncharacterized protein LOC117509825 n=1 Tax=Thalassophryne amazonica TaxID=390379 RepID=UPI001470AC7C|nr:uncharacterized protein LOC117509825 [Thalassophryne amazonica]
MPSTSGCGLCPETKQTSGGKPCAEMKQTSGGGPCTAAEAELQDDRAFSDGSICDPGGMRSADVGRVITIEESGNTRPEVIIGAGVSEAETGGSGCGIHNLRGAGTGVTSAGHAVEVATGTSGSVGSGCEILDTAGFRRGAGFGGDISGTGGVSRCLKLPPPPHHHQLDPVCRRGWALPPPFSLTGLERHSAHCTAAAKIKV